MDPETAARLRSLDCFKENVKAGYQPLKTVEGEAQIGRRENGECQFWKGGGCEIHREAGGPSKPAVCQLFPFGLVNTPDGYFVSLSYSCPTVLANSGPPASELRSSVIDAVASASHLSKTALPRDTQYSLTSATKIGWSDYLQIEERIQTGFDPRSPFMSLLLQVSRLLEEDEELQPNQSLSLPESARLLPVFVTNAIGLLEYPDDATAGDNFVTQLQQSGTPASPLLSGRNLTEFQILEPRTEQEVVFVERYVANFIFGKRLTTGPTIITRLLMLTGALAVLLFYLRQLSTDGRPHSPKDLEWVADILETDLAVYRESLEATYFHFEQLLLEAD